MSVDVRSFKTREEWLDARTSCIGGSDAACIIGLNPWKSNVRLWEEKTGRKEPDDLEENKLVIYGREAEAPLRELFKLDFPEYKVHYIENNMWTNSEYPWAHASLDGWLEDKDGKFGILEIKTTTISSAAQSAKWHDKIPDNYFCQLLHYFAVTGMNFAILKGQLKYEVDTEPSLSVRHYRIDREDVEADIAYLMEKEADFYERIKNGTPPPLILPTI